MLTPKAVQAGSSDTGTEAANLINRSGLRDRDADGLDEHSVNPAEMWRSVKGATDCWVEFDLGEVQSLGAVCVWNYNDAWHTDCGVRKADISVWTQETGWKKVHDDLAIEQAQGSEDYDEPMVVKLDAVKARKVRFDDLACFADADFIGLSEVQFFASLGPQAVRPYPPDGSTDIGVSDLELAWMAGEGAQTHRIYFGTSPDDLKPLGRIEQTHAIVSRLDGDTKYFWRIDEVRADGTVAAGKTWSFTTGGAKLAAWWKLDEASGDSARDSSGGDNHGTIHGGAAWVKGSSGSGLLCDGVDDYIDCGSDSSLMQVGSVSVAAWIQLGVLGRDGKVVSNQDGGSGYKLGVYTNNKIEFEIRSRPDVIPTVNRDVEGGTVLQQGVWYHVVGVYEKGRYIRTYVNGQLDREMETSEIAAVSPGPLLIGRESLAKTYWWLGALHDVCVFTYALDANDIKALHSGKEPIPLAGGAAPSIPRLLQAAWPEPAEPAVAASRAPVAPVQPQAQIQPVSAQPPVAEVAPRGSRNWIAVLIIVGVIGAIAGASFFMKQKTQ